MQLYNTKASIKNLNKLSTKIVYGPSMPRGRIYDRNYNVIVDNVGTNMISYKKESGMSTKDEIEIAYTLSEHINLEYNKLQDRNLREFWIVNNIEAANKKITDKEYELYKRRKLKSKELEELKINRITEEELNNITDIDRKAAYIYYLIHKG